MLEASRGAFSLSVAVCDDPRLRDYLIARLREGFPALQVVSIPPGTVDVYAAAKSIPMSAPPDAVFMIDLEPSLDASNPEQPTLRSLNASRELWEAKFSCPVVFWLAQFAARLLLWHARDFGSYRSHRFEFVSERAAAGEATGERLFPSLSHVDALGADERRFRVAELEARLKEVGEPPPEGLVVHVRSWRQELAYLYYSLARFAEAEAILRSLLDADERTLGPQHAMVASALNNLAALLKATHRPAEPLMRRAVEILRDFQRATGHEHPHMRAALVNYVALLKDMKLVEKEIAARLRGLAT
jgi:hypothetical protein